MKYNEIIKHLKIYPKNMIKINKTLIKTKFNNNLFISNKT